MSSLAYLAIGCDSNATGAKRAQFGAQTATTELVAHWETDHYTVELDASSLTPGLHYNLCVDPDGALTGFTFGDTGVRIFVTGAYTPPAAWHKRPDIGGEMASRGTIRMLAAAFSG